MRIISVPGRLVRDPVTRRVIDEAGIRVPDNSLYWSRMIAAGDVSVAPDAPATPVAAPIVAAPVAPPVAVIQEPKA